METPMAIWAARVNDELPLLAFEVAEKARQSPAFSTGTKLANSAFASLAGEPLETFTTMCR